ncbi:MAG TPA: hypothetical protein P5092_13945 [Ruminococcus sp.]|nr:hypothetical protein [Ruminococcus sp.]
MTNKKADTIMTILGMSGSGKTCYLLGMFYKMTGGLKGYNLHTDDDTHTDLCHRYDILNDENKGNSRFPKPTDTPEKFVFDLQYGYQDILSFEWTDYPGGYLKEKNDGDVEGYNEIKESILNSSTLFICIDGSLLCGDDTEDKIDRVRDNCSNVINHFFSEYRLENNHLPPTAFIVTKYDMCKQDTDLDELCDIIEEAFSGFFAAISDSKSITTIIPVTLGKNISEDDATGDLKPENIHLPIFMGIWFALRSHVKKLSAENSNLSAQIDELTNSLNSISSTNKGKTAQLSQEIEEIRKSIRKEEDRFFPKKQLIIDLTSKISSLTDEIMKLQDGSDASKKCTNQRQSELSSEIKANVTALKNALEKSKKLFEELDKKLPVVYLDGEKTSFKMIEDILDQGV